MAKGDPFILFITGTSASGKTTLYESLRTDPDLSTLEFHDIDEDGVPPVGRIEWRKYRVTQLLYDATKRLKQHSKSTVICGISFPHEIIESPYYSPSYNVHYVLVEPSEAQIRDRLIERSEAQKDYDNWDEVFSPEKIEKTIADNIDMRKILNNSIVNQRSGHKITTENLSKTDMHDQAKSIIEIIRKG